MIAAMKGLEDPDALVLHQAHPAKLVVDAAAAATSLWLLWRGRTKLGFAVHYLVPLATSAVVLTGDVSRLRATGPGRYVLSIPQGGHAVRAAGDTLMVRGARRHQPKVLAAGAVGVAAGWCGGLLSRARAGRSPAASDRSAVCDRPSLPVPTTS
jgi:hypothetical protein